MKLIKITIFICMLFVAGCCSPQHEYRKLVKNESSHDIFIIKTGRTSASASEVAIDSLLIEKNTQKIISIDMGADCLEPPFLSLYSRVNNHAELVITKDLNSEHEWKRTLEGTDCKGSITQCMSTIKNTDIVPK